jgi:hypothetical protein
MSISLQEARKKLDILEKLARNPELILTELFTEGVSGSNFLYQVKVNNKYILDYLKEYLLKIPVFSDCRITNSSCDFHVYVNPLRFGKYADYISDDKIIKIDADERTYNVCNKRIEEYVDMMNKVYKNEVMQLSDYWIRFQNLTFKKRFVNAYNSLKSDKKHKISNFFFWLHIKKSKVDEALNKEIDKINSSNKYNKESYNEDIEKQNYYLQYAPEHIQKIKDKQTEISKYLLSIGYKENTEMSTY